MTEVRDSFSSFVVGKSVKYLMILMRLLKHT